MLELTPQDLVTEYRDSTSQLRRLQRSGGRTKATTNAVNRHKGILDGITALLIKGDHKTLAGLLTEERRLIERIGYRKALGTGYEDLSIRLTTCRQKIKQLTEGQS